MKNDTIQISGFENQVYFARLLVALELRRTHGREFAARFLEEFDVEIRRAVAARGEAHCQRFLH